MSTLQNTISIIEVLPEADLLKIQDFAKKLSKRHELEAVDEAVGRFLPPKSREDIYRDLEISRQQDICSSARQISDGVAVATARKSNVADVQIDKLVCLISNETRHFKRHNYFMLYRIQDDVVYVDAIYHDLQNYEDISL